MWQKIPSETDVLITHGPPLRSGDTTFGGGPAGCLDLLKELQGRVKLRVHIFVHIHKGYGVSFDGRTLFVNAALVNGHLKPEGDALVVDLPVFDDGSDGANAVVVEPECDYSSCELVEWCWQWRTREDVWDESDDVVLKRLLDLFDLAEASIDGEYLMSHTFDDVCECLGVWKSSKERKLLKRLVSALRVECFNRE